MSQLQSIEVDVIIPVHNAASELREAVLSALNQEIPSSSDTSPSSSLLQDFLKRYSLSITVCCYDDGSSDESLEILRNIKSEHQKECGTESHPNNPIRIPSRLLVDQSHDGKARGAGYARNRAIELNNPPVLCRSSPGKDNTTAHEKNATLKFLCLLDSDDIMHKHRVIEQTLFMIYKIDDEDQNRTILGSTFNRDPPDSTWHYSNWANNLSDERLMLERYREITVLHPTWFMSYAVWSIAGGYIEAPGTGSDETPVDVLNRILLSSSERPCLIHPKFDTLSSLKLAEDLRFFHCHLQLGGKLRLHRRSLASKESESLPLVTYRHTGDNASQSFRTSRKLLLQLRALAFQNFVIRATPIWKSFVVWGCGRDGKDFFKALDQDIQDRVYCFVDVDAKKLNAGYYVVETPSHPPPINVEAEGKDQDRSRSKKRRKSSRKIPIVHFSFLIPGENDRDKIQSELRLNSCNAFAGSIDKSKPGSVSKSSPSQKKQKTANKNIPTIELQRRGLDQSLLSSLPVVVCVAMYRTNGTLESNVAKVGRSEGEDIWHFS